VNYRKLPDGTLLAPRRGRPPAVPDGYERDAGDAYIFLPVLESCDYRITEIKADGCCEKVFRTCEVVDRQVTRSTCIQCNGDPEWIRQST